MENLKINKSRLAIGSAQFGSSYGISNKSGIVGQEELENIIKLAKFNGIDMLDTATSYGKAQSSLGLVGVKSFKVITKIPVFTFQTVEIDSIIKDFIYESLEQLALNKLYGVLIHDSAMLLGPNAETIFNSLKKLQSEGLTKKIGISSYSPEDIMKIANRFDIDLVQAPMNLIDRRMESTGCLGYLKEKKIEIHIRSAFLQGLLLMPHNKIPKEFNKWSQVWKNWKDWQDASGLNKISACLAYPLSFSEVDRLVVGTESVSQLEEIIKSIKKIPISELPDISNYSEDLINPSKWKAT